MGPSLELVDVPLEALDTCVEQVYDFGKSYKVWLLEGSMGMGKTTFAKRLCKHLGVLSEVSSPSFGMVNEYETGNGTTIYHFDCYRMKTEEEAYDIGMEEYLDSGNLCLIEWAEKVPSLIPDKFLKVEINLYNSTNRQFLVTQNG